MRLLIRVVPLLIIVLGVVGLCRGWFSFSGATSEAQGDKVNLGVSVDKGKLKSDVKKAGEKLKEEIGGLKNKGKAKQGA
ncbi:MAG: hypothetical protein LLG00_13310 [Planctomycetaceae bacterium]|nr:hypothetical protein [Planctomycetaceae bacterium]